MIRKILPLFLALLLALTGVPAFAEEAAEHQPVVILYTNDVHCGIDDVIGYAGLSAYEKAFAAAGYDVLLADCGDAIQGAPVGTLSKGAYIVDIMNYVGYDVAAVGNHEFDYGMDRFLELVEKAEYPYVCSNFTDLEGNTVLPPYAMLEAGGWKIAFVGASTPATFTSSTPAYFQDGEGNYVYSFCGTSSGEELYAAIQAAVNGAREEGADIVVLLAHLGDEYLGADRPWLSKDVIEHTTGIDVVLDAHSHSTVSQQIISNLEGQQVILSSTGTKLNAVGALTITVDGTMSTALHTESLFQDAETAEYVNSIKAQYKDILSTVVATTLVKLTTVDPEAVNAETGKPIRIVRSQETNLGDLCADAYRLLSGADIGMVNGGGIRADINAGDITNNDILSVHPFGNAMCVIEATGQQVLDALEMGVSMLPGEYGGFQHVSGLTYDIDMSVETTVVRDETGAFVEVSGDRRVKNVMVAGEPLDPEKTYTVASHNYMLKNGGDGFNMFVGDTVLQDEVMLDNQVLITYITEYLGGVVSEEYADPYGQGRINFINVD